MSESCEITEHLPALVSRLDQLADPRQTRGIRHYLVDILTISVLAVICGANSYSMIHTFATSRVAWLQGFLRLPSGIPSQDTFERIFSLLDPDEWQRVFLDWLDQLPLETLPDGEREIVALDGKTSRGSATPLTKALHTVSMYSVQHALVLRAASVPEKTNEITVLPDLIRMVAPVGAIITTDAMGCQKEVAAAVREIAHTDYLLALKDNHPKLEADAQWLFAYHDQEGWDSADHSFHATENVGHGRKEMRECWLVRELGAVQQAHQWKDLNALVRVRATRTVGERTSIEERLYLTSLYGEASEALQASRLHWGIDNGLHWLLDVTFQDDASKVKMRVARQNWMSLRQLALGILRRPGTGTGSIASKRFRAALDSRYLQSLMTLR